MNRKYWLTFNGAAFIEIEEIYGTAAAVELLLGRDTEIKKTWQAVYDIAAILLEQSELAHRKYGYDKQEILSADMLRDKLKPVELIALRGSLIDVITDGMRREVENGENEEVDLGLEELKQQKKTIK